MTDSRKSISHCQTTVSSHSHCRRQTDGNRGGQKRLGVELARSSTAGSFFIQDSHTESPAVEVKVRVGFNLFHSAFNLLIRHFLDSPDKGLIYKCSILVENQTNYLVSGLGLGLHSLQTNRKQLVEQHFYLQPFGRMIKCYNLQS